MSDHQDIAVNWFGHTQSAFPNGCPTPRCLLFAYHMGLPSGDATVLLALSAATETAFDNKLHIMLTHLLQTQQTSYVGAGGK